MLVVSECYIQESNACRAKHNQVGGSVLSRSKPPRESLVEETASGGG